MSSYSKRIGDIGHYNIIKQLIKYNEINISQPIGDNAPYDIIIDVFNKLYKVQIKTTEFCKNGLMLFEANKTNPFTNITSLYSPSDIDIFMLYCIENDYSGLVLIDEYSSKEIKIRDKLLNNAPYYNNVRLKSDYELNKRIKELITTKRISTIQNHSSNK